MLGNQPFPFTKTVATPRSPVKKISVPGTEELRLCFTKAKKIDLFLVGDKKPRAGSNSADPDNIDMSSLTLSSVNNLDPKVLGCSDEQIRDIYKLNQLGLFFALCHEEHFVPGYTNDELIFAKLRNALSENITNPEEVVQEFINLWNDIAAYPIAEKNLGTKAASHDAQHTIFTFHEDYEATVLAICEQCVKTMIQSPIVKTFYLKMFGPAFEFIVPLMIASMVRQMAAPMLSPPPMELISLEKVKAITEARTSLFDADKPFDFNDMGKTAEANIAIELDLQAAGYTPYRFRERERGQDRDRTNPTVRRERSRSPVRGENADDNSRDRTRSEHP